MNDFNNDQGNGNFDVKPAEHRRVVPKRGCITVVEDGCVIGSFTGQRCIENATAFAKLSNPVDGSGGFLTIEQELEYHRAQDGLLTTAQEEARKLREELAEVKRPLEEQMARLNNQLISHNEEIARLTKGLDAYRGQIDRFGNNSAGDVLSGV